MTKFCVRAVKHPPLKSATNWKARQIRFVPASPVLSFSRTRLERTVNNPNAKSQFLLWYKLSCAYLEGFSNWVVGAFFSDYISFLFTALSWLQTKTTLLKAMEAGFLSELSFAWFYITHGSSISAKHSKGRDMRPVLLVCHLPFLIEGYPMRCSWFIL